MKKAQMIAGALLGLLFLTFGSNFFIGFIEIPPPPEDSYAAGFMGAMYMTGMLAFVKTLQIIGGVLVAIPKTRAIGLLILTPIIINIVLFHFFIAEGHGLFDPPVVGVTLLAAFLLWTHRRGLKAVLLSEA